MDNLENKLVKYVSSITLDDFSDQIITESKIRLIDTFAVALYAFNELPVQNVRIMSLLSSSNNYSSTLWGTSEKVFPDRASFANGCAVRYLDYNDTYLSKEALHPSDSIPAILAIAEAENLSGSKVIEGLIVSYEIAWRLADASSIRDRGWDHVAYIAISSALGASKSLDLSEDEIRNALSIAVVSNNNLRQTRKGELSMWKGFAAANASRNGVWAALLAKNGITGPYNIFEGEKGFINQISGPLNISELGGINNVSFKISETSIKCYPVEYHAMSAVKATLDVKNQIQNIDDIDSITLETFKVSYQIIGGEKEKWVPKTRETADHSLPYIISAVLVDGVIGPEQFSQNKFTDSKITNLIKKINVNENQTYTDRYPGEILNGIIVHLNDGTIIKSECAVPPGHFKQPYSLKDISLKFKNSTSHIFNAHQIESILDRLTSFDTESDISGFLSLLDVSG